MSAGTREALRLNDSRLVDILKAWTAYSLGAFSVRPFPAVHDAAEPLSFIIDSEESGRILFATDTGRIGYSFRTGNIRHLVVEANYSDSLINDGLNRGTLFPALAKRIRENHLSLERCREFVQEHNTATLENVVLIHLSGDNADPGIFRDTIAKTAPYANVCVAVKDLVVPLDKLSM